MMKSAGKGIEMTKVTTPSPYEYIESCDIHRNKTEAKKEVTGT